MSDGQEGKWGGKGRRRRRRNCNQQVKGDTASGAVQLADGSEERVTEGGRRRGRIHEGQG